MASIQDTAMQFCPIGLCPVLYNSHFSISFFQTSPWLLFGVLFIFVIQLTSDYTTVSVLVIPFLIKVCLQKF